MDAKKKIPLGIRERQIIRHALGLPDLSGHSNRNRYLAAEGSETFKTCERMAIDDWLLKAYGRLATDSKLYVFSVTTRAAYSAIFDSESLDPQEFPTRMEYGIQTETSGESHD